MDSNLLSLPNSSSTRRWKYHVFLSFRGEDTRYKFTDHLYTALIKQKIVTFRDNENLEKGKVISPELWKAIEESRFAIVILSENYAFSSWCLDELAKIIECEKELGMTVLPVFYYVDPTDVRKQTKTFKKAFDDHEKRFEEKRVKTWRDALIYVTNIAGFTLKNTSPETQEIELIVENILRKLAGCHLKNISPETRDIQRVVRQISHTKRYGFTDLTNEDIVNFEKLLLANAPITDQAAFEMANMEELHTAASAYYWNAPNELRQPAEEFFNSMDTNGDRRVSFDEFVQFFAQNGYNFDPNLFCSLDRNGNGCLDFNEVVTFYYILKTRRVCCNYCGNGQLGLYFTCVACFDNAGSTGQTYDLCCMCYEARRHQQQHPHHNYFLDSYVLLRAKAGLPLLAGAPNVQCGCCRNYLKGLYFTCVACFDNARSTGHTYDLCSKCYGERRHQLQHPHHNHFLDSYILLLAKAGLPLLAGAPNLQQALVQYAPNISQQALVQYAPNISQQVLVQYAPNISQQALVPRSAPNTPQQKRWKALQALEMALIVGNMAAHGCRIM